MGIISSKATDAERRTSCTMYNKHKLSKEITVSLSVSQRFRVQRALIVCKIEFIVCFVKCIGVMVILWHKSNISCKEIRLPRLHQHISSPSTKCFHDCWQRVLLVECRWGVEGGDIERMRDFWHYNATFTLLINLDVTLRPTAFCLYF